MAHVGRSKGAGWPTSSWFVAGFLYEDLMNHVVVVFVTVFLAELGDKTQLATLLFAADRQHPPLATFAAAAGALIASTALAVVLGWSAERTLQHLPLKLIAGLGFVAIGTWTIWSHFRG